MNDNKLNIVTVQRRDSNSLSHRKHWREEAKAYYEHQWQNDPEQFNPLRNCMERERIERTWQLAQEFVHIKDKLVADLACGGGTMTKRLKESGAHVHALDIAPTALKILREQVPNVDKTYEECLPHTTLDDDAYDLIFADEVIALLPSQELRLFMSELCRLIKPQGFAICSTPLDLDSQDPLQRFASLAETEFKVHKWVCSHHRLYIRLRHIFGTPKHYARAYKNPEYRQRELQHRKGFSEKWLRWNSQAPLAFFWTVIQYVTNPIDHLLKYSRGLMLGLEKICRLFWGDSGISHAIFIASRRPLQPLDLPKDEIPVERKGKRHVWE